MHIAALLRWLMPAHVRLQADNLSLAASDDTSCEWQTQHSEARSARSDELVRGLRDQYLMALHSVDTQPLQQWAGDAALTHDAGQGCARHRDAEPLMLSSAERAVVPGALQHAFGLLVEGTTPALLTPASPIDVLRLFAPVAYPLQTRHAAALPPVLVRRDHHTPGIDSPHAAPNATFTQERR
jgi:hypothetical protein